jgi:hypothetical protein
VTPGSVHSPVHNLRVSPLGLPPRRTLRRRGRSGWLRADRTERRLPIYYGYDTQKREDADSTLTTRPSGPKSGVHLKSTLVGEKPVALNVMSTAEGELMTRLETAEIKGQVGVPRPVTASHPWVAE